MKKYATNRIVWIDLETTGLDPDHGRILEIAIVVTDGDLHALGTITWVFAMHPDDLKAARASGEIGKAVWDMHTDSGLLEDVRRAWSVEAPTISDGKFASFLDQHDARGAPLGGNSPHFDRRWIRALMPQLHTALGYRNIDVSTILQLLDTWGVDLPDRPSDHIPHRAMPDITRSIDIARAFRRFAIKDLAAVK